MYGQSEKMKTKISKDKSIGLHALSKHVDSMAII